MTYQYADWRQQSTTAAKIERLELHIAEVDAEITAAVGAGGRSRDPGPLNQKIERLERNLEELRKRPSAAINGGIGLVRFKQA